MVFGLLLQDLTLTLPLQGLMLPWLVLLLQGLTLRLQNLTLGLERLARQGYGLRGVRIILHLLLRGLLQLL